MAVKRPCQRIAPGGLAGQHSEILPAVPAALVMPRARARMAKTVLPAISGVAAQVAAAVVQAPQPQAQVARVDSPVVAAGEVGLR